MSKEIKEELENEIGNLILKYSDKLKAGEINESIVGFIFCSACTLTCRLNPNQIELAIKDIEKDHIKFITENAEKVRGYFNV
jgi:hypothetical protein